MLGYNVAYDLLLKVLKEEPNIRAALIRELLKISANKKILRFPGGTVSRTWTYNKADMDLWIQFCLDAGVEKQTFVWNIHDHISSLNGLNHLKKHQEVTCIEVGNEENYHQRAKGFWAGLINRNSFLAERYYRPKGQAYGKVYNEVKNICHSMNIPIAAVFGVPNALAHKWWNKGVIDYAFNLKDIVIHRYRKFPDENFLEDMEEPMNIKLKDYDWWFTELNVDYENGKYYDKRFTEEHQEKLTSYINWVNFHDNTKIVQVHSLYKHNGFGRFKWINGKLEDNYAGWGF